MVIDDLVAHLKLQKFTVTLCL